MVESIVDAHETHQVKLGKHRSSGKTGYEKNIYLNYAIEFLSGLHFITGVLLPFFLDWGQISFSKVMILQGVFLGFTFLMEIPTGTIADYLGRKQSIIMGYCTIVVGALVYSSYPAFWVFAIGESLWATGSALLSGAQGAFLYDSLKQLGREQESKKILGRTRSIGLVGILIAAPVGSLIASTLGLRYTMMFMAFPIGLAAILSLFLKEPTFHKGETRQKYFDIIKNGFNHIRKNRDVQIIALDLIVVGLLAYFVIWTNQQRLMDIGVPNTHLGYINMIWLAVEILIANSFVMMEKVLKSKKAVVFLTSFATGMGFVIMALTSNISIVVVGVILAAGFGLGRWILLLNYLNKHIPSQQRAMIISTIVMFKQLAHVVLNPLIGFLVEWNLVVVLLIIGGLLIVWTLLSPVREKHLLD